ncbi:MAG: hypothetical protein LCH43_02200 [Actinobacteria bacterium]|nr:hypothetical protein [Actinomycetota bacterium]
MYPSRPLPDRSSALSRASALFGAVILGGVIALSAALVSASPASAASTAPARVTPEGETLFAVSCDWSGTMSGLQVLALNGATGSGVAIGAPGSPIYFCAIASSWDRSAESCRIYTMARGADERPALLRTDLISGASTLVTRLTLNGQEEWFDSFTIDGSGAAWTTLNGAIYSVDLTSGEVALASTPDTGGLFDLTWSSHDNEFYAHDVTTVYRVDVSTGSTTSLGPVTLQGGEQVMMQGMAIDSSGAFWFSRLTPGNYESTSDWVRQLVSASPDLTQAEVVGDFRSAAGRVGVIAMLPLPEQADCGSELPTLALQEPTPTSTPAALAATGASDPLPIVVLAIGTAVAGAALIGAARLRSRRR